MRPATRLFSSPINSGSLVPQAHTAGAAVVPHPGRGHHNGAAAPTTNGGPMAENMADKPLTLAEKVWRDHIVVRGEEKDGERSPDLLYIDLHLVHEVTSPQAFEGLRLAGRS